MTSRLALVLLAAACAVAVQRPARGNPNEKLDPNEVAFLLSRCEKVLTNPKADGTKWNQAVKELHKLPGAEKVFARAAVVWGKGVKDVKGRQEDAYPRWISCLRELTRYAKDRKAHAGIPEAAVAELVRWFDAGGCPVESVLFTLGEMGSRAKGALPAVKRLLDSDSVPVAKAAYRAVAKIESRKP